MKKVIKLTASLMASGILISCSGNTGTDKDSDTTTTVDTAAITTAEVEIPEILVTPDLTFAEVKGSVKSVKTDEYLLRFDEEGNIVSGLNNLKRDKEGRISSWDYDEYKVNWTDGLPVSLKIRESDGGEMLVKYTYNKDGLLTATSTHASYPGEEEWEDSSSYTYSSDSMDDHGNWVKRQGVSKERGTYTQTRQITYFPE